MRLGPKETGAQKHGDPKRRGPNDTGAQRDGGSMRRGSKDIFPDKVVRPRQ